jgi:hypothetical protein
VSEENERFGSDVVKNTFKFLLGKEAHDDDSILVVEEGRHCDLTLFQMLGSNFQMKSLSAASFTACETPVLICSKNMELSKM